VALLRGINVGGRSTVPMSDLKASFERMGFDHVRTYINSGNVIFGSRTAPANLRNRMKLRNRIEGALAEGLGREITVVVRDTGQMGAVVAAMPPEWQNDGDYRSDVYFSDLFTEPDCLSLLPLTPGIEEVCFVPGAVLCRIQRSLITRSHLTRIVGTELYRQLTARNCNTVRKLHALLTQADSSGLQVPENG
jgi:uncharacterized protein (DUF1697 family)